MAEQSSSSEKGPETGKERLALRGWWTILVLVITFLSGGLAGQVFNYFVNRPKNTTVIYRIVTTTLTAPEATGLIPNLKVLIGQDPIKALYAHNVEISTLGYIPNVEVGLDFSSASHIYGTKVERPSKMHSIVCPEAEPQLYRCTLKPISSKDPQPYRITVASDSNEAPKILATEQGVEFVPAEQARQLTAAEERGLWRRDMLLVPMVFAAMLVSTIAVQFVQFVLRRVR